MNGWNDVPCHWRELHFVCQKPICSGEICENFHILIYLISEGDFSSSTILAISGSCAFGVLLLAALAFLVIRRLRRNPQAPSVDQSDVNPVYGMYYFADGDHIDYANVEVEDANPYYDN